MREKERETETRNSVSRCFDKKVRVILTFLEKGEKHHVGTTSTFRRGALQVIFRVVQLHQTWALLDLEVQSIDGVKVIF